MPVAGAHIEAVRRFNRFYTQRMGVLDHHFLESEFSLTDVRVLYELAARKQATATQLVDALGIDPGYLSRILRQFEQRGLVRRRRASGDGRRRQVTLTARGTRLFAQLDARQRTTVERLLEPIPVPRRKRVVAQLESLQRVMSAGHRLATNAVTLRSHRPGDIGWITHRQAILYWQEYGWDARYEALIARIMADFLEEHDPKRERCWVAERNGEIVGSIFCVRQSDVVAKLRLLYVEPSERGSGLGTRLVRECVAFARSAGYRSMTLWTNSVLTAARRIYEREGFSLSSEKPHSGFGKRLIGQTWEFDLRRQAR